MNCAHNRKESRDLLGYSVEELRVLVQEDIDSGPPVPFDLEGFKKEARRRLAERQG